MDSSTVEAISVLARLAPTKPDRGREEKRVRALAGNQARIALLKLIQLGSADSAKWQDIKTALEIAESYHPESDLRSF